MNKDTHCLNSQLIFGVKVSEEFFSIINEHNLFSFNHEDDILFHLGEESILGFSPPHEESYNTKHHILYSYSPQIETKSFKDFNETLIELKKEFYDFLNKQKIDTEEYHLLIDELNDLKKEIPQLFLFSQD